VPAAILKAFAAATGAPVLAVSGNVDDRPDTETEGLLPSHRLLSVAGWRLLLVHIVGPKVSFRCLIKTKLYAGNFCAEPGPTSKGGWVFQVLLLVPA
jgi:hypothetical protein